MDTTPATSARASRLRKALKISAAGLVLAVASTSTAMALNGETAPKRYTGCLKTNGTIHKIKAGSAPTSTCASGEAKITLGNGDITGITAGTGLTGSADQGTPTIGLKPTHALPQGCAVGSPAKRSSTGWYCGTDAGLLTKSVGGLTIDKTFPTYEGKCVGDYSFNLIDPYIPPTVDMTKNSASFQLGTATYMVTPSAATKWYVNRTTDMFDGEQFSRGFVRLTLKRVRSGVTTTVATWARSESENLDGTGLPYTQDPGVLTTLANDSYYLQADVGGVYCTRVRMLDAGMDFTRIG